VCPALLIPGEIEPTTRSFPIDALVAAVTPSLRRTDGTLLVLDLPPVFGIHVGTRLACLGLAHPVPVLPRWPYSEAVLPAAEVRYALLTEAKRLPRSANRLPHAVFILDAERNRPLPKRRLDDHRADNRYSLSANDLPDLATLQSRGIRRIVRYYAS
jgi:hypothetical protein